MEALFRRGRFERAVNSTRKTIVRGWKEYLPNGSLRVVAKTPDEDLARRLSLGLADHVVRREENGKMRDASVKRIVVPPMFVRTPGESGKRGGSRLFEEVKWAIELAYDMPPDWVVETMLPGGRTVFLHSFRDRVIQRMFLSVVESRMESRFLPGAHAYRRNRSRFTALTDARSLVRRGWGWVAMVDIRHCFQSISYSLLDRVLQEECPWMSPRLHDLALWFQRHAVVRRPGHPGGRGKHPLRADCPVNRLLEGSVVAPMFSNLVLSALLDRPFQKVFGETVALLRYSDDMMLLGRDAAEVAQAVECVEVLLEQGDLHLHPEKGHREPVDVRVSPIRWLGKFLHGGTIQTPRETVKGLIERVVAADPATDTFRSLVGQVRAELCLDPQVQRAFVQRELRRQSPSHARALEYHWPAHVRPSVPGVALAVDGEDYDLAAASAAVREGAVA